MYVQNLAYQLDQAETQKCTAMLTYEQALDTWKQAEAKARLVMRTQDEAERARRRSNDDVIAAITIQRNDPDTEVGRAWMAFAFARAAKLIAYREWKILDRAHWREVRGW